MLAYISAFRCRRRRTPDDSLISLGAFFYTTKKSEPILHVSCVLRLLWLGISFVAYLFRLSKLNFTLLGKMAVQLAPYNNSMRLGQGFNSYTQQICLNDAVMRPSRILRSPNSLDGVKTTTNPTVTGQITGTDPSNSAEYDQLSTRAGVVGDNSKTGADVSGRGVSQIVSYSSRFVDKLSDVTGKFMRTNKPSRF